MANIKDLLNTPQYESVRSILNIAGSLGEQEGKDCLLYTSPSPRDRTRSRMPSSA